MLGKKLSEKSTKKFLYIHTNIVTEKWVKKTRETNFPETHEKCVQKMLGKKSSEKSKKNVFLYSQYRYQKIGGEKTRETIFPETQE